MTHILIWGVICFDIATMSQILRIKVNPVNTLLRTYTNPVLKYVDLYLYSLWIKKSNVINFIQQLKSCKLLYHIPAKNPIVFITKRQHLLEQISRLAKRECSLPLKPYFFGKRTLQQMTYLSLLACETIRDFSSRYFSTIALQNIEAKIQSRQHSSAFMTFTNDFSINCISIFHFFWLVTNTAVNREHEILDFFANRETM